MGLFRKKNEAQKVYKIQLMQDYGNSFYGWNGQLYKSEIIRSCIKPKVAAIGKLVAKHYRGQGTDMKINPEVYMRFLLEDPNPLMTGQMLQEKLANQLELNNNAFAKIYRNTDGYPTAIYPIVAYGVSAKVSKKGELELTFSYGGGKKETLNYRDVIHLRQDFNENEVFGTSPKEALENSMEVITTSDQGIIKAVKNSNAIRWIMKLGMNAAPKLMREKREEFEKTHLNVETGEGNTVVTDDTFDVEQVSQQSYVPNAAVMDRSKARIYDFFGTNEKIIQSKYSEDEWNAYYESKIEPVARQMSEEFTRKLFSRKERGYDNRILFTASSLQFASMSNKLNLFQMVDRGAMTPNQWREILNLAPAEGGDEYVRRLDTAVVNQILRELKALKEEVRVGA